jgi:hypothetical protein
VKSLLHVTYPVFAVVGLVAGPAHADAFGEVEAGVANPIGNGDWTNLAATSFKLDGRLGFTIPQGIGAALQLDWTPLNLNGKPPQGVDVSAYRLRLLPTFVYHHSIAPKLGLSARVGVGIDYIHESGSLMVLGTTTTSTSSDTAFAFELGGGLWYDVGAVELGGELALPISSHSNKDNANYSSFDIDILIGVRFSGGTQR